MNKLAVVSVLSIFMASFGYAQTYQPQQKTGGEDAYYIEVREPVSNDITVSWPDMKTGGEDAYYIEVREPVSNDVAVSWPDTKAKGEGDSRNES